MKKMILLLISFGLVWAMENSLTVRDANVTISINNEEKQLQKDENLTLDEGSIICFKEGKGRVIINRSEQLNAESNGSCVTLALSEDFNLTKWLKNQKLFAFFSDSIELTTDGVSNRGDTEKEELTQEIYELSSEKKEMVIYSESFGPLPVILTIKDSKDKVIQTFINKESIRTFFRVPVELVDVNYTIQITNRFNRLLLDLIIVDGSPRK